MPVIYNQAEDPNFEHDDPLGPMLPEHMAATERMSLHDGFDPMDSIVVQFNPTELSRAIDVHFGELQPIGWSHPIQQYASTGAVKMELHLWLSAWAAFKHGSGPTGQQTSADVENMLASVSSKGKGLVGFEYISYSMLWLESHCYASNPGKAPAPIWLRWDYNLDMLAILTGFKSTTKLWDGAGRARIIELDVALSELRIGFRSSNSYAGPYDRQDSGYKLSLASGVAPTGTPYRPAR